MATCLVCCPAIVWLWHRIRRSSTSRCQPTVRDRRNLTRNPDDDETLPLNRPVIGFFFVMLCSALFITPLILWPLWPRVNSFRQTHAHQCHLVLIRLFGCRAADGEVVAADCRSDSESSTSSWWANRWVTLDRSLKICLGANDGPLPRLPGWHVGSGARAWVNKIWVSVSVEDFVFFFPAGRWWTMKSVLSIGVLTSSCLSAVELVNCCPCLLACWTCLTCVVVILIIIIVFYWSAIDHRGYVVFSVVRRKIRTRRALRFVTCDCEQIDNRLNRLLVHCVMSYTNVHFQ